MATYGLDNDVAERAPVAIPPVRPQLLPTNDIDDGGVTPPVTSPPAPRPEPLVPRVERDTAATDSGYVRRSGDMDAVTSQVAPNETTSGQLTSVIDPNNPALKQARDRATVQAASRGLQNSSIAAQAGEQAYLERAIPIANADAAAYARRAELNQQYQNQFNFSERQYDQSSRLQEQAFTETSRLQNQQYRESLAQEQQRFRFNQELSRQSFEQAGQLSEQEFQQNIGVIQENLRSNQAVLATELQNALSLSDRDHQELLSSLDRELQNALTQITETSQARIAESGVDYDEARRLALLENQNLLTRQETEYDLRAVENRQLLENRIQEIQEQGSQQMSADARRLQLQFLEDRSLQLRQASEQIAQINLGDFTTEEKNQMVNNLRITIRADLLAMEDYYSRSPLWDPLWGSGFDDELASVPGPDPMVPPATGNVGAPGASDGGATPPSDVLQQQSDEYQRTYQPPAPVIPGNQVSGPTVQPPPQQAPGPAIPAPQPPGPPGQQAAPRPAPVVPPVFSPSPELTYGNT